ncbi:hypothetical protein CRG98_021336, partial [Punica granatum]
MPAHSPSPDTHVLLPLTLAVVSTAYLGAPSVHLPPPITQMPSNFIDPVRFTVLEGMVNQLAANMNTNMAKLMGMLRDQNRASSSYTPPPEHRATVDPNPVVPRIYVTDSEDVSFFATTYMLAVYPVNDPLPPPLAPTTVPLPPAAFLSADSVMHTLPPLTIPAQPPIYIMPPPTVHPIISAQVPTPTMDHFSFQTPQPQISFSYPAPPPLNIPPSELGTPTQAAPAAPSKNIPLEAETQQERRIRRMEETIRALQAGTTRINYDWFMTLKATDIPTWADLSQKFLDQYKFYAETAPTLLELNTMEMKENQAFEAYASEWRGKATKHLIEAGKKLDMGIKLGRIKGSTKKKEEEETPKKHTTGTSRRTKDTTVSAVNLRHQSSQQFPVNYTPAPSVSQTYAYLVHYAPPYQAQRPIIRPRLSSLSRNHHNNTPQFKGALGHTINNYWRLREKIQEMIDAKQISFNEETPVPFIVEYVPAEITVASAPFVIQVPANEPYQDNWVPWSYEESVANNEQEMNALDITRLGRVYEGPEPADKGKAPAAAIRDDLRVSSTLAKKWTEEEAEAFMKVIKASEYKVVEQMGKSLAHILLLALLLSSKSRRDPLLKVLTATQVPKEIAPERIKETVSSIFSNQLSFAEDELPSEGYGHLRALHIVCNCNNHVVGQVMIDNGSALNVCPVFTLKQMNVDMSRIRANKTTVRAFDGSRREVNGEIDLLIDVGPCSFSITFQIVEIPNAFSLLLGRPWIHAADAVPSSLRQKLKFFAEGKLITVNGEEDYTIYKEIAFPYISIGEDQNLPFHSFNTIFVIRDYGEVGPSRADIMQARSGKHFHRLATHYGKLYTSILVPPLSHFFSGPPYVIGSTPEDPSSESEDFSSDTAEALFALPAVYAITEETSSRVPIRLAQENEELTIWTSVPCYSAVVADVQDSPCSNRIQIIDGHVPEIDESLHRLENHQLTSVEPTEEINIGIEEESRTLRIGIGLDPVQRARIIDFLTEYQEVFAWSDADMPGLDPSIVKHFLPLDTERFPAKRQHLRRQRADLLLRIKEEVIKQVDAGFLEVMPFGLKNAGATYQQAMVTLFHDMMHKEIEVYVDNMIAKSKDKEDHLVNLKRLFEHLKKYKLRLNPAKCTFSVKSGKLLGFVVSKKGIEVDPNKVKAIMELPLPSTVREVRSFLGRLNYIAHFIANLIDKCQPLFRLLRKNGTVESDDECQKAFDTVKAYLIQPPVLVPPSPDHPLILYLTYTHYHTIRLLSKTDPLKYLLDNPSFMRNLAKWRCQLTEYDIDYVSHTSVKCQAITDHLAEFPIDDDMLINSDFPDEGILQLNNEESSPRWKMYFDSAVNSTRSGIGAVLISLEGHHFHIAAKIHFPCTNNIAKYKACILGLRVAVDLKVKELEVFGDSILTIFQTLKQWKTKDPKLVPYHEYLKELVENFEKVSFTYTPCMKNQFADALATLASIVSITKENLIEPLKFEIAQDPTHCDVIDVVDGKPWYADIKYLLQTGQFPAFIDRHDRRILQRIAANFFLSGETLYRRSFDTTLLRHCHLCQVYANPIKALPNELHLMAALWPFSMWGMDMDVISPINPKTSNGHLFILVAIDYFTKWIETITLASVTIKVVARFLKRDIIAWYG